VSWKRRAAKKLAMAASRLGVPRWLHKKRQKRRDFRVFILEYHAVAPEREEEGAVSAARFCEHLGWLKERWRCVTVAQAAARLRARLDEDLVAITFDDGYADNARVAFPLLREAKLPATVYLATGFLDGRELWFDLARRGLAEAERDLRKAASLDLVAKVVLGEVLGNWPTPLPLEEAMRRLKRAPAADRLAAVEALRPLAAALPAKVPMTWEEARQLREGGIELGAHTVDHPILSKLDEGEQERQIAGSIDRIEEELGERPCTFAMPNGSSRDYDSATLRVLARLKVEAACTTRRGANADGCDLLQLRRIGVGSDSLQMLDARLAGFFDEGMRRAFSRTA
jgi:peptidoglycan/xylan/chitin deacetylase (PgdA/CDA1 family)